MSSRTLDDLFLHELRELYDAEHELVKILAAMTGEVRDARTAQLLNTLRCETRNHVFGLEQVLSTLGQIPRRVKCRRVQALQEDYHAFLRTTPSPPVRDTFDLMLAVKALRGAITSFRILITLALRLNRPQLVDPLRQCLWEEEAAAERLHSQLGRPELASGVPIHGPHRVDQAHHLSPAAAVEGGNLPPDSPEDRENILAGGQESL